VSKFDTAKQPEAATRALDLKQWPSDFTDDPLSYLHALRDQSSSAVCR
jgi:hypothetical protein